jgi:hypothetical protein
VVQFQPAFFVLIVFVWPERRVIRENISEAVTIQPQVVVKAVLVPNGEQKACCKGWW